MTDPELDGTTAHQHLQEHVVDQAKLHSELVEIETRIDNKLKEIEQQLHTPLKLAEESGQTSAPPLTKEQKR